MDAEEKRKRTINNFIKLMISLVYILIGVEYKYIFIKIM